MGQLPYGRFVGEIRLVVAAVNELWGKKSPFKKVAKKGNFFVFQFSDASLLS